MRFAMICCCVKLVAINVDVGNCRQQYETDINDLPDTTDHCLSIAGLLSRRLAGSLALDDGVVSHTTVAPMLFAKPLVVFVDAAMCD